MSEIWIAAVVSAAGTVYSTESAKKSAKGGAAPYSAPSIADTQKEAIDANFQNQGSIEALINRGNSFNADQALSVQNKTMPGYSALAASLTNRAKTLADNPYDVPKEVQDNIARIAAERGISAGTRGQFNDFSLLRDFGVNELQYGQSNINQAQSLTGLLATIAPKVNPMSPLSFYVTPPQALANATGNSTQNQAIAQSSLNAQNAASANANADLWGSLSKVAGLYASSKTGTNGQQSSIDSNIMF